MYTFRFPIPSHDARYVIDITCSPSSPAVKTESIQVSSTRSYEAWTIDLEKEENKSTTPTEEMKSMNSKEELELNRR